VLAVSYWSQSLESDQNRLGSKPDQTSNQQADKKDLLSKLHYGLLGSHLGVRKTLNKVRQWSYRLQARGDVERQC
jgi:hypothetical protein